MILKLTDGVTTLDLTDGINYAVPYDSWSPQVSRRRAFRFTEGRPFLAVEERIPLHVRGATSADALRNVEALNEMLDKALLWSRGLAAAAVLLIYQPTNGVVMWQDVITGGAPVSMVGLSPRMNDAANYEIDGVRLTVERRGQLLSPDSGELATNGGFEEWSGAPLAPDGWDVLIDLSGTPLGTVTREGTTVFAGEYSLSMYAQMDGPIDTVEIIVSQQVAVPEGYTGRFRARVFVEAGRMTAGLRGATSAGQEISQTGQWVLVQGEAIADGAGLLLEFGIFASGASAPPETRVFVDDVSLVILGQLSETAGDTVTATAANGAVITLDFGAGAQGLPSPTLAQVSDALLGSNHLPGWLLVSERVIETFAASKYAAGQFSSPWGAAFTAVADSGSYATGTVLRYTPTVTTEVVGSFEPAATGNRFGVWVKARNNSDTATYQLRLMARQWSSRVENRPVILEPGSGRPQVVFLGEISLGNAPELDLGVTASATGAGTLDLEQFYIMLLDEGNHAATHVDTAGSGGLTSRTARLIFDHGALTLLTPRLAMAMAGTTRPGVWPSRGGRYIYTQAGRLYVVWLVTGRFSGMNTWRQVDPGNGVIANQVTVSRLPSALSGW